MKINDFITNFESGSVEISKGVSYNTREIIERNERMRNSEYLANSQDMYLNVVWAYAQHTYRESKLTLKEFQLQSLNGKMLRFLDVLRLMLITFLKHSGWADIRDRITRELIEMGHVVTKVVDGETKVVNLLNLVMRPDVTINEGGCAEYIYLTYDEAFTVYGADKKIWPVFEECWENMDPEYKPFFTLIEFWTTDEFETENKNKEITKGCIVYLEKNGKDAKNKKSPEEWEIREELDRYISPHEVPVPFWSIVKKIKKDKIRVFPHQERRLIEVSGRNLGKGFFEIGREAQEYYNELHNVKREHDQTFLNPPLVHEIDGDSRQEGDGAAFTQDFINKRSNALIEIMKGEKIYPVPSGSNTFEIKHMIDHMNEFLRFSLGITYQATGNSPSNKTASFAVIQQQTQQATYREVKQRIGQLFEDIFQNFLLEDIIETITKKDVVMLAGDDEELRELDEYFAEQAVFAKVKEENIKISEEELDAAVKKVAEQSAQSNGSRHIDLTDAKVKKNFKELIKQLQYNVTFSVTDENIDLNSKIAILQDVKENPGPRTSMDKANELLLSIAGFSSKQVSKTDKEMEEERAAALEQQAAEEEIKNQALGGVLSQGQPDNEQF